LDATAYHCTVILPIGDTMTKTLSILAFCLFTYNSVIYSQPGKVCNWDGDKNAAVVLTFDDWSPGQYPIVVPELKKRDINATFFLMLPSIATWNHPWSDVVKAAANGNEMANHTQTHPDLTKQTAAQLNTEIRGMKRLIDQNVTSAKAVSFAYPMGPFNNVVIDSLKKSGHIAARTVMPSSGNYTYNFAATENDYFKLLTYGMDGTKSTPTFFNEVKKIIKGGGLLTYMYHSVDNAQGTYNDNWFAKVLQDSLQKQMDALIAVKDKVWITTMGQAIRYHREARCSRITEIAAFNGAQWVVELTDTLSNNTLYNQPLSIKLKMNGISVSEISQNGKSLSIDAVANDSIMFRAIPDGGQIILKGNSATSIIDKPDKKFHVYQCAIKNIVTIESELLSNGSRISIYNLMGQEVKSVICNGQSNTLNINLTDIGKGVYLVTLQSGQYEHLTQKIVLN
jgi:hypothetical protein